MNNEQKEPPLGYNMIQEMTATKLLNDAAPDMLDALEGMVWLLNKQSSIYCILPQFDKMVSAIKKAKGL